MVNTFVSHIKDNVSTGWEKNKITPKSYGIEPVVKFHPHLSPRGEIPSLIEHIVSFHLFL